MIFFKSKLDHVLSVIQKALHDLTPPFFMTSSYAIISSLHPASVSLVSLFLKSISLFSWDLYTCCLLCLEHSALDPHMPNALLSCQSVQMSPLKEPFLAIPQSLSITLLFYFLHGTYHSLKLPFYLFIFLDYTTEPTT